jgi:hypothetical protein
MRTTKWELPDFLMSENAFHIEATPSTPLYSAQNKFPGAHSCAAVAVEEGDEADVAVTLEDGICACDCRRISFGTEINLRLTLSQRELGYLGWLELRRL